LAYACDENHGDGRVKMEKEHGTIMAIKSSSFLSLKNIHISVY
jgi:hypothetical protein